MKTENQTIYRVHFATPPIAGEPATDYYFTSLAAIYEDFTAEDIGCSIGHLYNEGVRSRSRYRVPNTAVTIYRETIHRKAQKAPRGRAKAEGGTHGQPDRNERTRAKSEGFNQEAELKEMLRNAKNLVINAE